MASPVPYALVGAGGFGAFCIDALSGVAEVELVAVSDADPARARELAKRHGVHALAFEEVLADASIALVHLATPPAAHAAAAIAALRAGKHVLVEKPLATSLEDAARILAAARETGRLASVDFVLRHHPLWQAALAVARSGLLGDFRRWDQNNLASGERLHATHWFWDRAVSGGILVEHAVHFLDLCRQIAQSPAILAGGLAARIPDGREDRVLADLRFASGAIASLYHSFERPDVLERSDVRLVFERGEMRLSGWVPEALTLEARLPGARLDELATLLDTRPEVVDPASLSAVNPAGGLATGGDPIVRASLTRTDRNADYTECVRSVFTDLARSIRNPAHQTLIRPEDGLESLRLALAAREASDTASIVALT